MSSTTTATTGNNNAPTRANRRETRSQYNSNNNRNNDTNNNNNQQSNSLFDRRKQQQQQQQRQQQPQQSNNQKQNQQQPQQQQQQQQPNRSQDYRDRSGQRYDRDPSSQRYDRDRSNQRGGGQYAEGSFRDSYLNNLGSVKFTPGLATRELPPIETRPDATKKFTGRCRLFVGNLPHNTTEEKVRKLFEPFGEIGEVFLGLKSSFAFVKMDTRQSAEAARDKLDCSSFEGRFLRVRLAAHAAAIRIKNLSPVVTNELLAYAFRYFGEIERAVVVVDDKGKSTGEGIVEYSKKQSAMFAIKKCQQECFLLTASLKPVNVEPYDQHDEDEGLPEKSANKNSIEYKEQRDKGPRFAEPGTFEATFAQRWKDLYALEKQKRERLEQEIEEGRKSLEGQIEYSRVEYDTMQLQNTLKQLEDNRLKLQQMKEQSQTTAQQREELRRQQDLLIKQREEEVLRRQQMGDQSYLNLNQQPYIMQDMMGTGTDASLLGDQSTGLMQDSEAVAFGSTLMDQPRTFADVAMMGMNQQFMQQPQQMNMSNLSQQAIFTQYIPPPTLQTDSLGNSYNTYQQGGTFTIPTTEQQQQQQQQHQQHQHQHQQQQHQQQRQATSSGDTGPTTRQQKMTRSYVNQGNNINVPVTRPRKRGRF